MNPEKYGSSVSIKQLAKIFLLLPAFLTGSVFAQSTIVQTASLTPVQTQAAYTQAPADTSQVQNLDELLLIAEQFLAKKTKNINGKIEITVNPLDNRLKLSACQQPIAYLSQGARIWGKTTVAIRCEAPAAWRIMVKADVKIHTEYLAAAKPLPQGHLIQSADLTLVTGDITAMRAGILTDKEHAIGSTVIRSLQPGAAIWPDQLRTPKAIQQGQTVRIISQGRGFTISGEGHAINSASEGQVAKARMANGSIIRGIAKADGIIAINF